MCQLFIHELLAPIYDSFRSIPWITKWKPVDLSDRLLSPDPSNPNTGEIDELHESCANERSLIPCVTAGIKEKSALEWEKNKTADIASEVGSPSNQTRVGTLSLVDILNTDRSSFHSSRSVNTYRSRPPTATSENLKKSSRTVLHNAIKKRDGGRVGRGSHPRGISKANYLLNLDFGRIGARGNNPNKSLNRLQRGLAIGAGNATTVSFGKALFSSLKSPLSSTNTPPVRSIRISNQTITRNRKAQSPSGDSDSLRKLLQELEARNVKGFESYEAIKKEQQLRDEAIRALQSVPSANEIESIRQVSQQTKLEIKRFLESRDQFKELHSLGGFLVTPNNLRSLSGTAWLNDEVINAYLFLVKNRQNSNGDSFRLMVLNSMFFTNLQEKGYKSISRWSKRAGAGGHKILELDGILIPVHKQAHWTLAYINVKARRLEYYDSLFGNWSAVGHLREYLRGELGERYIENEWTEYAQARQICPVQRNGYDCGVFLCKTAEVICREGTLTYTQNDIPKIRILMQADLINGSLDWQDLG